MLDFILDPINEFIRDMLKGWIEDNLSDLFVQLNNNVAGVTIEVSQTPSTWNGSVFSIVQNLSETVIVPIAAVIITYVLCYELISMLIDRNNMHDFDTALFLKYIFKAGIAVSGKESVSGEYTWEKWEQTTVHERPKKAYFTLGSKYKELKLE